MPTAALDPSWMYALNEAFSRNLLFGRDVVFTFGPLGAAYAAIYHPATDSMVLAVRCLVAASLCTGFLLLFWNRRIVFLLILPFSTSVMVLWEAPDAFFSAIPMLLLLVVVRLTSPPNSPLYLPAGRAVIAGLILISGTVGLLPLIKGSFGGIGGLDGLIAVALAVRARHFRLAISLTGAAGLAFIIAWLATGQHVSNLWDYFSNLSQIISGYSEAMSNSGPDIQPLVSLVAAACIFSLSWGADLRAFPRWLVPLIVALNLCVGFKAGFVRQDGIHVTMTVANFFFTAFAVCSLRQGSTSLALTIFSWLTLAVIYEGIGPVINSPEAAFDRLAEGITLRLQGFTPQFERALEDIRRDVPLPSVNGTVDIYPTELAALFAHGFEWSGRPVFQSYSAYTPALDTLNSSHLSGSQAPAHIFFSIAPIDERLPAIEDAGSWPELMSHYAPVGYDGRYLHMIRSPDQPMSGPEAPQVSVDATLGQWVNLPRFDGAATWAKIEVYPTLVGRIALTGFRIPQLNITIQLDDGRKIQHRLIADMASRGFLLSPYIGSTDDFALTLLGANYQYIRNIMISTSRPSAWIPHFKLTLMPFKLPVQKTGQMLLNEPTDPPGWSAASAGQSPSPCKLDHATCIPWQSRKILQLVGRVVPSPKKDLTTADFLIAVTASDGQRTYYRPYPKKSDYERALSRQPYKPIPDYVALLDVGDAVGPFSVEVETRENGLVHRCLPVVVRDRAHP